MTPFTVTFQTFTAKYLPNGEPESYHALVSYTTKPGGAVKTYDIQENHPLVIGGSFLTGGTKVYLGGHGFAPRFVVTEPAGQQVVQDVDQVFLPQETTNYLSEGYLKVTDGCTTREPSWFAVHGIFAPSIVTTKAGPSSNFPAARNPELLLNALAGDPSAPSVYDVPAGMKQLLAADGSPSIGLKPGGSWKLANGYTVTFVGRHGVRQLPGHRRPRQEPRAGRRSAHRGRSDPVAAGAPPSVLGACAALRRRAYRGRGRRACSYRPGAVRRGVRGADRAVAARHRSDP